MKKLLVVCGPTATGKTNLALKLAEKFDGEIISFDSRQVYIGMDIGTGKDVKGAKLQNGFYLADGVKIWLYDLVNPDYKFSVADYLIAAKKVIKITWQGEKLPILVGGTGFYIQALLKGLDSLGVSPDWELRKKLGTLGLPELQKRLGKLDFQRWQEMNKSDRQNPRRLIRAIEIALNKKEGLKQKGLKANVLKIGLKTSLSKLYNLVDQRVEQRVKEGVEEEIKALVRKGYHFKNSVLGSTIGYKEWQSFFEGRKSREEVVKDWKNSEHGYVRRQQTWFRKDKQIRWFDISGKEWQDKVERAVLVWYTEK